MTENNSGWKDEKKIKGVSGWLKTWKFLWNKNFLFNRSQSTSIIFSLKGL